MPRAKSVILSSSEKKAIAADLKEKLKVAKGDVKTNEAAQKAADKIVASTTAAINKLGETLKLVKSDLAAAKADQKAAKATLKGIKKPAANAAKTLASIEKQLAALTA